MKIPKRAGKLDIVIEAGTTFDYILSYADCDGLPIDLTGYTARMKARTSHSSLTVLLDMTTANGKLVLGGIAGTIQLLLDAVETAGLTFTCAVYDLELVSPGGVVTRLIEGKVSVSPEVTY